MTFQAAVHDGNTHTVQLCNVLLAARLEISASGSTE